MELTRQKISGTFQGETLRIGGELYSTQDVGVGRTTATMALFFNLPKFKFQSLELCGELRPPTSEGYWGGHELGRSAGLRSGSSRSTFHRAASECGAPVHGRRQG